MKKNFLIIAAVLGFAVMASAQPKAIGMRMGDGLDISYEHFLDKSSNFLEFELGFNGWKHDNGAFDLDGTYNFMITTPDWGGGEWGFYGGPGASLAIANDILYAGIIGNLGLEFTFDTIPLQLSLDVRPRILFGDGALWSDGIFNFGLGIRYAF